MSRLFDIWPLAPIGRAAAVLLALSGLAAAALMGPSCQGGGATPPVTPSFEAKVSKGAAGLLLFDSTAPQDSDRTFEKILLFYGLTVRKLDLSQEPLTSDALTDGAGAYYRAIAVNHRTLEKTGLFSEAGLEALRKAVGSGANLLVSGISPSPEGSDSPGLLALTGNVVRGARKPDDSRRDWQVESWFPEATLEFTGQRVSNSNEPQEDFALNVEQASGDATALITSWDDNDDKYPIFVRYRWGLGSLFLDSSGIGNLEKSQMWVLYNSRYFGRIVPTMMFVRYAFGDMAWHSKYRFANMTVDDPALTEPWYSFSYRRLLLAMSRQNLHATIAMPPATYERAQKEVIDLFLANPERFSLVPHGNDHEEYEFYKYSAGPADSYQARPLPGQERDIVEALTRMEEFKRAAGLPYGKVMVFPYNIAPAATIGILKKYDFMATVNSANVPLGETPKENYDFNMFPAVMEYGTFPLLERHTPENLPYPFLFFLGRPALTYGHIDDFRDGGDAFNALAQDMGKSWGKTPLEWKSLDYIIKRLYLEKVNQDGTIDVKFFTNDLVLENQSDEARVYNLWKAEGLEIPIEKVEVEGLPVAYRTGDGLLHVKVEIPPKSSKEVR
ncbi:MAG: hypothetical protein Q8P59_01215, partial [Dehalococcoidia bacterium]|nr:hypothetical protein [Dehalococcoidia bacterium]